MTERIIGNYQITGVIGHGGMGTVYRGTDLMLRREVAIKTLRSDLSDQSDRAERFRSEAIILAKLNHPNIATVYGLVREGNELFMVMELVSGRTLDSIVGEGRPQPWPKVVTIARQVLEALDYAHRAGVVHRDIKPANVMVTAAGTIKIMDFGIARLVDTDRRTRAGHIVGTVAYGSPEQIRGEDVDGRSDLYSTAVMLYELLAGRLPYPETNEYALIMAHVNQAPILLRQFAPDAPAELEAALSRALAKSPADRFQRAADFSAALGAPSEPHVPAFDEHHAVDAAPESHALPPTRLAPSSAPQMVGASGAAPTRLADEPLPPRATVMVQAAEGSATASRLNWRHVVSGAALLLLVLAPLAFFIGQQRAPKTNPPIAGPTAVPAVTLAESPSPQPQQPERETMSAQPLPPPSTEPRELKPAPPVRVPVDAQLPKPITREPLVKNPAPIPAPEAPVPAIDREAPPPAAPSSPDLTFDDVKLLEVVGEKTKEVDVLLRFKRDTLVVQDRRTGAPLRSFTYPSIASATYSESKHPRWKEGLGVAAVAGVFAAPVFFMKSTRHWLTLQSSKDAAVLRLNKKNFSLILPTLEGRAGMKVERPAGEK